jgi:carboxylesterase type B
MRPKSFLPCLSASLCLVAGAEAQGTTTPGLSVDLGYAVYTGVRNITTGLNVWKGIRYAAPPVGKLRWQAPQTPTASSTATLAATFGPACPQSLPSFPSTTFVRGNEDCLFLNVYSPTLNDSTSTDTATGLPVLVWIHGGGYGEGSGQQDMAAFINTNGNGLVAVTIQYRV